MKNILTPVDLYHQIKKRKGDPKAIQKYIEELETKYHIPVAIPPKKEECSKKYQQKFLVNNSRVRFHQELKNTHLNNHWTDICHYPEVIEKSKLIYNTIVDQEKSLKLFDLVKSKNLVGDTLVLNKNNLENTPTGKLYDQIINIFGFQDGIVDKIKMEIKNNKINFGLIINLDQSYPRNLIYCPINKIFLADRYGSHPDKKNNKKTNKKTKKKTKSKSLSFVCPTKYEKDRLEIHQMYMSIWLMNKSKKNKKRIQPRLATIYLSENFPGQLPSFYNFLNKLKTGGFDLEDPDIFNFWVRLKDGIDKGYFYSIETSDNTISIPSKKKTKKKSIKSKSKN